MVKEIGNCIVCLYKVILPGENMYYIRAYETGLYSEYLGHLYHDGKIWHEIGTIKGAGKMEREFSTELILKAFPKLYSLGANMGSYVIIPESKIPPVLLNLL